MANRDYYIDPGKEADDFVKAFIAMSNNIRQNQYNQARIDYYRALTQKASRGSFFSSEQGQKMLQQYNQILRDYQQPTPREPAPKEPAPKAEPAPKPRSEAEPAPTTPKAAETPTTPSSAPSKTAAFSDNDTALPETDAPASPQLAASEPDAAGTPALFEDDKAIPA